MELFPWILLCDTQENISHSKNRATTQYNLNYQYFSLNIKIKSSKLLNTIILRTWQNFKGLLPLLKLIHLSTAVTPEQMFFTCTTQGKKYW